MMGRATDPSSRRRVHSDCRGSVTAELAMGLPAVLLALVVVLVVASAATAQVRCTDAARAAARAAALGTSEAEIMAVVADLAGPNARVQITQSDEWVEVVVTVPIASAWADALDASARAVIPAEP